MNCKICGMPYSPEREVDEDGNICAWSKNCECKEPENIALDAEIMHRKYLIGQMKYAYKIHKDWAEYQKERKESNKRIAPNAGDEKWHRKWMKTYKQVIKELNSKSIPVEAKVVVKTADVEEKFCEGDTVRIKEKYKTYLFPRRGRYDKDIFGIVKSKRNAGEYLAILIDGQKCIPQQRKEHWEKVSRFSE